MLVPCEKREWKLLEPYAWDMLGNLEAVSFPLYHDGVKTETRLFCTGWKKPLPGPMRNCFFIIIQEGQRAGPIPIGFQRNLPWAW